MSTLTPANEADAPSTALPPSNEAAHAAADQNQLQLVTFQVGTEQYGIDILAVQEINRMLPITRVPQSPPCVEGVVNLRGRMPTLGSRVALALVEHLRRVDPESPHPLPHLVASALRAIAERDPDGVTRQIDVCLHDSSPCLQEVAVRLIPEMPTASALERVWELHRPLARKPSDDLQRHQLTSRAFSATVAAAPGRAIGLLRRPESDEADLVTLMYGLAGAGGEDAAKVWHEHKRDWARQVPAAQARCIVNCILRFRDHDEIDRLEEMTASPDEIVGPWALVALALFDPTRAVSRLHAPPSTRLRGMERRLAQILLAFVPTEMLEEVWQLASQRPDAAPDYLQMLAPGGDRLGPEAADALIQWADRVLKEYLSDPDDQDKHRLHLPLTALIHLHGGAVLDRFRSYAGSGFEQRLAEAALRWADNTSGFVDHVLNDALQVLLKIGGEGLTRVVNAQLIAQSWQVRIEGCAWAPLRPSEETRRLVGELARSEKVEGREDRPFPVVQQKAADALAAMGENAALIRAILRWGTQVSPYVAELRQGQPPMPDGAIKPAVALLDRPMDERYSHAILALGHSGRIDYRAHLQEVFERSSPQSRVALCTALALARLGGCDDELLPRAIEQYRSGHHKFATLRLLAPRLPDEAEDLVPQLLPESPPYDEMDQRLIVYMARQPSRRPLVEPHLRHLTQERTQIGMSVLFERPRLLDPGRPDDQEELWRRAASREGAVHIGGVQAGAIERLAAVEPDAAFEVADRVIRRQDGDWATLPDVLLKQDAARAVPQLIAVAIDEVSMHVCHEIAVSLRRWAQMDQARASLRALLTNERWQVRRAGAYMAGFAGAGVLADALRRLILEDTHYKVCNIAVAALRRQQREHEAQRMVELLVGADLTRARATVEAVVGLADPNLLVGSTDPLAFWKAMRNQPPVLHRQAADRIEKRRKQVKGDLTSSVGRDEDGW